MHLPQNSRHFLKGKKKNLPHRAPSANLPDEFVFNSLGTKGRVNVYLGIEHDRERVGKNRSSSLYAPADTAFQKFHSMERKINWSFPHGEWYRDSDRTRPQEREKYTP